MKKLLLFLLCVCSAPLWATTSRWRDGKVEFIKHRVNGKDCWSIQERDAEVEKYNVSNATFPVVIEDLTPSAFEAAAVNLYFSNYSEYVNTVSVKGAITDKIDDLPPSQAKKLTATTDFLKAEDAKK